MARPVRSPTDDTNLHPLNFTAISTRLDVVMALVIILNDGLDSLRLIHLLDNNDRRSLRNTGMPESFDTTIGVSEMPAAGHSGGVLLRSILFCGEL